MRRLGEIKRISLRDVWQSESQDFTPWLSKQKNLSILGAELGFDLELESSEKRVGPFRADLLCRATGHQVYAVIENQIERSDHKHLGQVLTYGAVLNAGVVVWIAAEFEKEHVATIEWLNDTTKKDLEFFGVEISLFSIDGSAPAPHFQIVAGPNAWRKRNQLTPKHEVESKLQFEPEGCLKHLFSLTLIDLERNVSASLDQVLKEYIQSDYLEKRKMNIALSRNGLRLEGSEKQPNLLVANEHPSLRAHFHETPWQNQIWKTSLKSLPGVVAVGPRSFSGRTTRAISLPFSYLEGNLVEISGKNSDD